mmetsp:Transcript_40415/g.126471  ORF Transcript_40415/g.126471 Transcript_40415/m.126471 type:complete len:113 (-) Transcript_40415:507-845(-)|eukprot:CAMPEP_0118884630 /NCGR_PEP_ID=MMETSP1163-20130328/23395_1 /TAXON_ID=124430 /ORGANISM="Phaeomonas parva, Strain CCMP2877" /LENGTH=112 /DNA_ID=CAMNT_0006822443 /DNA_START=158 /DNA_END=496 /DNA_ORIENTATION=+
MSSGLQELMAAEQRATQIIASARAERTEKMKQAKDEAQAVIEEYRREKEAALAASASAGGGTDSDLAVLQQENVQLMATMDGDYSTNKEKTIEFLVSLASTVDVVFPEDVRK